MPKVPAFTAPIEGKKLTPRQWARIEELLDAWKRDVLAAARKHPARSYQLGLDQVQAYTHLLSGLQTETAAGAFGGVGPTMVNAQKWSETYTLRELDDVLNVYVGRLKDALLYGLRHGLNATAVASMMYDATQDATVNWRLVARTEMVRANSIGRLRAIKDAGYDEVWCPPHVGACKHCKRILEGRVFRLDDVIDATNFGRDPRDWVACIPLHPQCRHAWLPYDKDVYDIAQAQYQRMEDAGLMDEDRLHEMFDSSGQLRPGYAHVDFSAAKTWADTHEFALLDPYAEGLAVAVEIAVRKRCGQALTGPDERRDVALDALRVDAYQRELDLEKVASMAVGVRAGLQDPARWEPLEVSQRVDGTLWITDGQHRCEALKLLGHTHGKAIVRHGLSWDEESARCRAAIAKAWNADATELPTPDLVVAKTLHDAIAEIPGPEPDGPPPPAGLDSLVWDGLRPRPDIAMAVDAWWTAIAGDDWPHFSRLYLHPHGPVRATVDYDALRHMRPEWSHLPDSDLHFALIAAARNAGHGYREIAPGIPAELRVDPDPVIREDIGSAWDITSSTWTSPPAALSTAIDATKTYPDLTWTDDAKDGVWRRLLGRVAKATGSGAANAGVEHWITVHPNGPEEKGQPVLVRNNADGTMTVVGGAGGNLNYLRLDPSRRVDTKDDGKGKPKAKPKPVEQPVSEEEADRQQAEREQHVTHAREQLDEAKQRQTDAETRLRQFAKDELGVDLDEASPKERRKLMDRLRTSAMRTLTFGEVQRRDRADSGIPGTGDENPDETGSDPGKKPKNNSEEYSGEGSKRPQVGMTADQANALLDHFGDIHAIKKIARGHRKVITGEKAPSDANQIDWTLGGQAARDERRAKALEQYARTEMARQVLEHGDRQYKPAGKGYDRRYRSAFLQGGYDSVDAFGHSILGQAVLSRQAHDLLGIAGAAQLLAHHIQSEKRPGDIKKVQDALKDLTDQRERAVAERGLARVKASTELAAAAVQELGKSERGDGLFTTTMARSLMSEKVQEAKRSLGMMIGGLEACSALKTALDQPAQGRKIKVGGFSSASQVRDAAAKAGVKLRADEITRVGAGNYTLSIDPDRLQGLVKPEPTADRDLRDRMRQIRTGDGIADEIEQQRTGPGMVDTLDANQAKGKMFLQEAGSGLLGFDPGVGKTHTAIAAAMAKMHAEPGKHRALIVAPTAVLRSWKATIARQGGGHTVSMVDKGDRKRKLADLTSGADFTIVSYETLKGFRKDLADKAASGEHVPHSIVITDELQKAKNDDTANYAGVQAAVDHAIDHHGPSQPGGAGASFYGLTGTPIEKDVGDLNSMRSLVKRARGAEAMDRKTARGKYGKLGQDEHIARGDKVRGFREGLDTELFRLSASDAGNELAEPDREEHSTPLDPEHQKSYQERVAGLNAQIKRYHETKATGSPTAMPAFGGRAALMDELYGREDSSIVKGVADKIAKSGSFTFDGMPADGRSYGKGDHAGEYEHKHVVFGANETSRALFGAGWNKGAKKPGGLHGELERRGIKVFTGHGSMSSAQNEENYKAFLAHEGKAVFLTNDKNNAGISLQFGDNGGDFQHGATHLHHFTRPVNNAVIQQREARILRKGAAAKVKYHTYNAGTPLEQRIQDTLEREARTQDLAANAEQRVAGDDTLHHHLAARGAS